MATVVFIHGIANKPAKDILHSLWLRSLSMQDGIDLGAEGIQSVMVYWADCLYEAPQQEMAEHESNESIVERHEQVDMSWKDNLSADDLEWVTKIEKIIGHETNSPEEESYCPPEFSESEPESADFERIPLPWWLKEKLMKILLKDVYHYLFNSRFSPRAETEYQVQDEIRNRFVGELVKASEKEGPLVVVSHSMGTVIAYDCLKRDPRCPEVDALMTIGSPLGLDEVQDKLTPGWSKNDGFPEKVGKWVNVYDRLDPVAGFDPKIANDFKRAGAKAITDLNEQNSGSWRHNISKYLMGKKLREELGKLLEIDDWD